MLDRRPRANRRLGGQAGALAMWTDAGWRFIAPFDGMYVWVAALSLWARRSGGVWETGVERVTSVKIGGTQIIGEQQSPIATPTGGTLVDTEARMAVTAIILALRSHGLIAS